jgi:hypothetical protein
MEDKSNLFEFLLYSRWLESGTMLFWPKRLASQFSIVLSIVLSLV